MIWLSIFRHFLGVYIGLFSLSVTVPLEWPARYGVTLAGTFPTPTTHSSLQGGQHPAIFIHAEKCALHRSLYSTVASTTPHSMTLLKLPDPAMFGSSIIRLLLASII